MFRFRIRQIKRHELLLEKMVMEKTEVVNQQKKQLEQMLVELQNAQTQLVQSEKMSSVGQLAAGMAHEINNPLSFIQGNLEYISDYLQKNLNQPLMPSENNGSAPVNEISNALQSSLYGVKRISDVLQNLKNFSKIEQAIFTEINVNKDLDSIVELFFGHLKDVRFIKSYDPQLDKHAMPCYASEINLAIKNILMNAISAIQESEQQNRLSEHKGQIRIETSLAEDKEVNIVITDNGIGIPEEHMSKIFDPFFTTRPVGSGRGLGLSEAYGIIQKHGGRIEVKSTQFEGTTVIIKLLIEHQNNDLKR
jgi:signal transduction histidine kinase